MLKRPIHFAETIYHAVNGHSAFSTKIAEEFASRLDIRSPKVNEYQAFVELHFHLHSLALKYDFLIPTANLAHFHTEILWWKIYHKQNNKLFLDF